MVRRGVLAFFLSSSSVLNSRAIAIILYTLLYQLSKLPKPPFLFADDVVTFAFLRRRSSSSSISSEFINFVAFTFAVDPVTNRPMPEPTILGPIFFFFSSSSSIFFSVFVLTAIVASVVLKSSSATPRRRSSYSFSNFVHGF